MGQASQTVTDVDDQAVGAAAGVARGPPRSEVIGTSANAAADEIPGGL
jgi:hypothetical protein